eukprot:110649_1
MNNIWKMVLMVMVLLSNIGVKAAPSSQAVADNGVIPEEYSGPIVNNRPQSDAPKDNYYKYISSVIEDNFILSIIVATLLVISISVFIICAYKCCKNKHAYGTKRLNDQSDYESDATDDEFDPLNDK